MIILPEKGACFVCVPKTGTQAFSQFLEKALRTDESLVFSVESLYEYHANLKEVENTQQLPFSIYDTWTFAVVRNPFDRLVSYCASTDLNFQHDPFGSIKAALLLALETDNRWLLPQVYFTAGVKTIYKFEDLDLAIEDVKVKLGIDSSLSMSKVNESTHKRYPVYFNSETKDLAEHIYADDLREFDYRF